MLLAGIDYFLVVGDIIELYKSLVNNYLTNN